MRTNKIRQCPKCGHSTNTREVNCSQCGVVMKERGQDTQELRNLIEQELEYNQKRNL